MNILRVMVFVIAAYTPITSMAELVTCYETHPAATEKESDAAYQSWALEILTVAYKVDPYFAAEMMKGVYKVDIFGMLMSYECMLNQDATREEAVENVMNAMREKR